MPRIEPSTVPRPIGAGGRLEVGPGRHQAGELGLEDVARLGLLQVAHDLGEAEHAHGDHDEADAVGQFGNIERHARLAGLDVGADHRQQQPESAPWRAP